MKIKILFLALALSLSLIINPSLADIIKFKDGRELEGTIIEETESSLKVKTSAGVSIIGKGKIQSIIKSKEEKKKEMRPKAVEFDDSRAKEESQESIQQAPLGNIKAEEYSKDKIAEFMFSRKKREGNFSLFVIPVPIELLIANAYPRWKEKRYSYEEMVLKAQELKKEFKKAYGNNVRATLKISFAEDWDSEGKTSKKIPSDIAEYIFLENDRGKFVRCKKATVPPMGKVVNMFNKSSVIMLEFPTKLPDTNESIFKDAKKVKFVVGGLGFTNNKFEYELPFSKLFADAPPEIKKIYYGIGIWKKTDY